MDKHHNGCYEPENAKTLFVENPGEKNSVKETDKFSDNTGGSEKKSASDNRAFQVPGIEIIANFLGGYSIGNV